ncbi:leucyl aminopeptidase [Candidatus Azambacteria bacterium]|nr:leucyl aminopeptidase [Candidatus Azambacteria bacterium]
MKIKFLESKKYNKNIVKISLTEEKENKLFLLSDGSISASVGIQDKKEMNTRKLVSLARKIILFAKTNKLKNIAIDLSDFVFPSLDISKYELAKILAINFKMANFEFTQFKTASKENWSLVDNVFARGSKVEERAGFKDGAIIGDEVNGARVLANAPGGDMTPAILAEEAKKAARGTKVKVKILSEAEIRKLKMGGILGVAKGSDEKPKFIIMEYKNGGNEKPIVLVGKGVTFDTGGLNLKPSNSILEMNMDMSGGAAVIHAVVAAAKLGIKKNIVALVPAVENMPSGSSYRPGDILRSMSGKTIEVLNTDAEGRIILADALTYAERYKPRLVVDAATLTGAAVVALGQRASAVFSKDENIAKTLCELGERSGDYLWPLPLWDEYEDDIKGTFGDFANTGKTSYGGAINGAIFLYQFAKEYPWAHIDIAPKMTSYDGDHLAKGASGAPVRLLVELLKNY